MNCPTCNVRLSMTSREGVEIDYCPNCRGVWLDRGELDKIIERSATDEYRRDEYRKSEKYDEPKQYNKYGHEEHHSYQHKKHKKKESFLSDLFDF